LRIPLSQCYLIFEQHQLEAIVMRRTEAEFFGEQIEGIDSLIELPFLSFSLTNQEIYEGVEVTATCLQESELEYNFQI
jgi:hypothetical protein